jgi:hypothetical protein
MRETVNASERRVLNWDIVRASDVRAGGDISLQVSLVITFSPGQ